MVGGELRVAGVMVDSRRGDPDYNLERVEHLLREAAGQGASVACTQEGCLEGYVVQQGGLTRGDYLRLAERIPDGARLGRVRKLCASLGLMAIVGLAERSGEEVYNSAAVIEKDGRVVGVYRKIHDLGRERLNRQGDALPVFGTSWGRFGVLICSDRHYPEAARVLALQGAQVLFIPAWGFRGSLNTAILRTRAHENRFYVVFVHPEECCVASPKGEVMVQEEGEGRVVVFDLDLEQVGPSEHEFLALRRPELYGPLAAADGGRG